MSHRILVRFEGEGSGVEELSWGQRSQWGAIQGAGRAESAGGTMPLAEGTTTEEIATLLGFIMSRHQSLRTRVRLDAQGDPQQVLFDSGEIELEVVDAQDAEDPAEVAESVRERYNEQGWDLVNDWPVRMAVIQHRGVAAHFVALYAHFVIDGYGFEALVNDLVNLDKATGRQLAPVAGVQPMEQARIQQTRVAIRQGQASLRRWEHLLRTIPPRRYSDSPDTPQPRYWEASYSSRAGQMALAVIAERTKVHSGAILLGAYAVGLARITGDSTCVVRILVSNRFRPGFAESVSSVAQSALCVFDVADCSLDEVAERAWKAQLAAGMHAYYDPRGLWELVEKVSTERGVELNLRCYFNDRRRSMSQGWSGPLPTEVEVRAALPQSELRWGHKEDTPDATSFLHINSAVDTLDYTLRVDTHTVSPAELEGFLRGIEALLVEAAFDPTK